MPLIRLLVAVGGNERATVKGDAGTVLEVDSRTARQWADGERAERVLDRAVPVERTGSRGGGV